ncbi:uncharacterized protein LOC124808530 isoform X1 [Hydra vulgaris]|uniref:uncharacterized protein LOC124808530 isoform X1 n=1 Tax=Hydra vulgaris TaxID=6087 RepID=UPI0032EA278C
MYFIGKKMSLRKSLRSSSSFINPDSVAIYYCQNKLDPEFLVKKFINSAIGFGVFVTKDISSGEFLCEYDGILSDKEPNNSQTNNYLFSNIAHCGKKFYLDGSNSKQMGAYINDTSVQYQNCNMKKVVVDNKPCLCLFAIKDIKSGTELRYNYGDKADNLWWRTDKTLLQPYILSDGTCVPAISKQHSLKVSEVLKLMKNESLPVEKSKVVQNTSKVEFSSKSLNPPFIKIEDKSRLYRPMYKEEIESGFPFNLSFKRKFPSQFK